MAKTPGFCGQSGFLDLFNFDGTIASNSAPQLIVPKALQRSYISITNPSDTDMYIGFGPATALATVTSHQVASIAVGNAGFGYTYPPTVNILGGGSWNPARTDGLTAGLGAQDQIAINKATALATLSGGAVSAINMQNLGNGYDSGVQAPYVRLDNDPRDPFGCFAPSATQGQLLAKNGGVFVMQNSIVCTEPFAIFCGTASKRFTCAIAL
jgi:hypothetical protein